MRTNAPGGAGPKALVDELLDFSHGLGADYSCEWADASTLVVTAVDVRGAAPPRLGLTTVAVRHGGSYGAAWPNLNVTNEHGSSVGSMGSATLEGSFGSTRPPALVSVTVSDADNGDEVFGYCDLITFRFDMPTDKVGGRGDAIDVYELFSFANPADVVVGGGGGGWWWRWW